MDKSNRQKSTPNAFPPVPASRTVGHSLVIGATRSGKTTFRLFQNSIHKSKRGEK
ncbi:type IV secretory pathway VirB4 component [Paraburkholderia sp. GAS33]|uniref:hypothetical protein n=1 Tax=Paraburkholderia sp. GAS33 TaxID=3035130 RepID=UPI003D1E09F5